MISITGASGFIGSYVANKLDYSQKRLSRQSHPDCLKHPHYVWLKGDYEKMDDIRGFVEGSSTLIHFACSSHPRSSNLDMKKDIQSNLIPTIHLFEAFAKANPNGHIIYSSTGGNMYDAAFNALPRSENDLPHPQSSYGIHKLAAENYLRLICELHGIKGTILRISNPYGVLLPKQRAQGLIGVSFAKMLANEPIAIVDSLASVRDYIHLDDVSKACELAIQHPPKNKECRLFNVSSGIGRTLSEVLELIEATTGFSFIKQYPDTSLPEPTWSVLSYQKIQQALGWHPQISLEQGLQNMWMESLTSKHTHQFL